MSVQVKGSGTIGGLDEGLVISGIVTATSLDISGDIDVDGHTNLDHISVAGVSTFSDIVDVAGSSSTIKLGSGANRRLMYRSGDNDIVLEAAANFFYRQKISDTSHRWYTNGSDEKVMIDASGRVLIGTTTEGNSSADNLTIADSGESGITVRSGTSQGGHVYFSDATSGTAEYQGLISYQHSGDFMKFGTAATERLRIDSEGDIFIGTSTDIAPTNGTNLCVSDATISRLILEKQSTIKFGINVSSGFSIYDETNDAARLSIKSNGYVGVNQTDPQYPLHVSGATTVSGPTGTGILMGLQHEYALIHLNAAEDKGSIIDFSIPGADRRGGILYYHATNPTVANRDSMTFFTSSGGTPAENLRISSQGYITKPNTVNFQAYNGADVTSQSNYMVFTSTMWNDGGGYNTSNGVFTAPVTGTYLFTLTGLYTKNNSSATWKLVWHVNNSNKGVASEYQSSSLNNSYNTIGTSSIIYKLTAGHTMRLYVEGSGAFHVSGAQTRYCGYLLG